MTLSWSDIADWGSVTTEDATQNAALAAIMFLAGGLGKDSPHCIISLVGSDPTVRPLVLNTQQATKILDQRAQLVQQQKVLQSSVKSFALLQCAGSQSSPILRSAHNESLLKHVTHSASIAGNHVEH